MITFIARGWSEENLAQRLSCMLYSQEEAFWDEDAQKWHLSGQNNFFLRRKGSTGCIFQVSYRYSDARKDKLLLDFMKWRLGVEEVPNEN